MLQSEWQEEQCYRHCRTSGSFGIAAGLMACLVDSVYYKYYKSSAWCRECRHTALASQSLSARQLCQCKMSQLSSHTSGSIQLHPQTYQRLRSEQTFVGFQQTFVGFQQTYVGFVTILLLPSTLVFGRATLSRVPSQVCWQLNKLI